MSFKGIWFGLKLILKDLVFTFIWIAVFGIVFAILLLVLSERFSVLIASDVCLNNTNGTVMLNYCVINSSNSTLFCDFRMVDCTSDVAGLN